MEKILKCGVEGEYCVRLVSTKVKVSEEKFCDFARVSVMDVH